MRSGGYERGFNLPSWSEDGYDNEGLEDSLKTLRGCGADSIALVPTWYQKGILSSGIRRTKRTASDSSIRRAADKARALGFRIMIKPHLDTDDGTWRASIYPIRRKAWFKSYSDMILNYARVAQEHGIETLCIGTELTLVSRREEWRMLISGIRAVYSGELTFAANWDAYEKVSFWDALDSVGIDFYAPLAKGEEGGEEGEEGEDPGGGADKASGGGKVEETYPGRIGRWMETFRMFSVKIGKPLLFTEVGYRSAKGAARKPWDYRSKSAEDEGVQARCYRAVLESLESNPWVKGAYFWLWDAYPGNESKDGYSPRGKEAEKVLRKFWCKERRKRRPHE